MVLVRRNLLIFAQASPLQKPGHCGENETRHERRGEVLAGDSPMHHSCVKQIKTRVDQITEGPGKACQEQMCPGWFLRRRWHRRSLLDCGLLD